MNIFLKVILTILVFLAISSGVTKILLMPQDVEFFGNYGFTNSMLIAYGVAQLIGGILLIIQKTRIYGAVIVAITFLISAVVLILAGNILFTIITIVAIIMLGMIIGPCLRKDKHLPA